MICARIRPGYPKHGFSPGFPNRNAPSVLRVIRRRRSQIVSGFPPNETLRAPIPRAKRPARAQNPHEG